MFKGVSFSLFSCLSTQPLTTVDVDVDKDSENDALSNKNSIKSKAKSKRNNITSLSFDEARQLMIGDEVDYRNSLGRYFLAKVVRKRGFLLGLHLVGYPNTWDTECDVTLEFNRLARARSVSRRMATRLGHIKAGDFVYVKPRHRFSNQWISGKVLKRDGYSGQVQVMYGSRNVCWLDLNSKDEIADAVESKFAMFLRKNAFLKYKGMLSDLGINDFSDFERIYDMKDLDILIDNLKMPIVLHKKFKIAVFKYTNIEGLLEI